MIGQQPWWIYLLVGIGLGACLPMLWERWLRAIRGEFHCPQCKIISPLPKD